MESPHKPETRALLLDINLLTFGVNDSSKKQALDIAFENSKFQKQCNDQKKLVKRYGTTKAKLLRQRLDELHAAPLLEVIRSLHKPRCHELKGIRAGQFSVDLDGPYRLIFKPAHNPQPRKADGGLDWSKITAITILGIEDTHE